MPGYESSANIYSYFSSKPFRFVVNDGEKEATFTIHSALVAKQSPKFNALVNNGMKESREGFVYLEEDPMTFHRFAEFVYTGAYDVGEPERLQDVKGYPTEKIRVDSRTPTPSSRDSAQNFPGERAASIWQHTLDLCPKPPDDPKYRYRGPGYDHTEILLAHAKLYVFADYHGVKQLRDLSLYEISAVLDNFSSLGFGMEAFVELAKSCYANTIKPDPLRMLVIAYATCQLE